MGCGAVSLSVNRVVDLTVRGPRTVCHNERAGGPKRYGNITNLLMRRAGFSNRAHGHIGKYLVAA